MRKLSIENLLSLEDYEKEREQIKTNLLLKKACNHLQAFLISL